MDNELFHHGIKGMKWGVWNSETASRYTHEKKSRKTNERKTNERKAKEKLRKITLESNDPAVVKKGMHLLTNEELRNKLERMELEDRVISLENKQQLGKYTVKSRKNEARQKTLRYAITKDASNTAVNQTIKSIKNGLPSEIYKNSIDEYSKKIDSNLSKYMKKMYKTGKNKS